jgi:hypothetical protein
LKIQGGGGRHLGFAKILIASMWIWLFCCNLNCIAPDVPEIWNFHKTRKILKNQGGGGRQLGFTIMILASAWIGLFGCNLNSVSKCLTEIGKCRQNATFGKSKMAAAARIALFGCNLNSISQRILKTEKFHKKCIIKNPRWRRPPSWNYQSVNNFHID